MTEHVPEKGILSRAFRGVAPTRRQDNADYPVVRSERLTVDEAALILGIFGDELNISKVRKDFTAAQKPGTKPTYYIPAQTFGAKSIKFYGPHYTEADYSKTVSDFNYGTFVHEMTHIWQNQNPDPRKKEKNNSVYTYALSENSRFEDFGEEQQAALIEDYARQFLRARRGAYKGTYLPSHGPDKQKTPLVLLRKVVETRFPQARKTRLALKQKPDAPEPA